MTEARGLLKVSLEWMDRLWDERLGLLRNPDYGNGVAGDQPTMHLVRETCWYALGLLMRGTEGDLQRAHAALCAVLEHQFTNRALHITAASVARRKSRIPR